MADASYDAIIIGAGNKALILAMYLVKYGGMDVALFEKRHEAGGGWSSEESSAPGFLFDTHCTIVGGSYQLSTERDFPEWQELGGKVLYPPVSAGAIFSEDHSFMVLHTFSDDPSQQQSAKSIAKFSERDAETWVKLAERYRTDFTPAILEYYYNPPPPPGELDAFERLWKDPNLGFDPSWSTMSPLQVLRDIFESDALIALMMRLNYTKLACAPDTPGMGLYLLMLTMSQVAGLGRVVGGTHNWAHAASKIILANGGKIFTNHEVDKVIIENGRAKAIRLTDNTEVQARKLVVSTLDPHTLCFRLIGKEYLNSQILRRVENLERSNGCIAWYHWALHEFPNYRVASLDRDINEAVTLSLISKDPEALTKEAATRKLGKMPEELMLLIEPVWSEDRLRTPEGKCSVYTEQFVLPATALTEREWLEFKKSHGEAVIKEWQKYADNMTWDNVIGYTPFTPYDACHLANMAPTGNTGIIDRNILSQLGRNRPIPELSRHKTPIESLYATGSAWHPHGQGGCWQGYNCYKIIAEDFGLRKPWDGRPW